MMRLIKGELFKLLSQKILCLLALLLIVNAVMSISYVKKQANFENSEYLTKHTDILLLVEEAFTKDPEGMREYYASLEQEYDKQFYIWNAEQDPFSIMFAIDKGFWLLSLYPLVVLTLVSIVVYSSNKKINF